jgi:hypothetical protein
MSAAQDLEGSGLEAQWLFRQGDLVLGPLSGQQLVEKLYTGELTADTQVVPAGGNGFRRLGDLADFRVHAARAAVKVRVEGLARAEQERRKQQRLVIGGVSAVVLGALALGAWQGGRYLAVHLPGSADTVEDIRVEPPTITPARFSRFGGEEELFEYRVDPKQPDGALARVEAPETAKPPPEAVKPPPTPGTPAEASKPAEGSKPTAVASAKQTEKRTPPGGRKPTSRSNEPDGLEVATSYDQAAINRVVKKNQPTLFRCFREEAERRPNFSAKVPLEFTVGNDGRVAQLWVDHPQLKRGPMFECLFSELKKWSFPTYEGERATVSLSFTIGKKG